MIMDLDPLVLDMRNQDLDLTIVALMIPMALDLIMLVLMSLVPMDLDLTIMD